MNEPVQMKSVTADPASLVYVPGRGNVMPFQIPARIRDLDLSDERYATPEGETAGDVALRLEARRHGQHVWWERRLPVIYREASLAGLLPSQDKEGRVSGWLDRPDSLTLLLHGEADKGKTYCLYAVGAAAVARGITTIAYTAADLNAAMRPGGDEMAYERVTTCDLLLLDDLGRESVSAWSLEQLQRIIDHRTREGLRQVVTTNLPYDGRLTEDERQRRVPEREGLVERYGTPVAGRLTYQTTFVRIDGASLRHPAAY